MKIRCGWAKNELAIHYHDTEWGVAVHDDRKLFEFLILEGAQAGLSWDTILAKRENYRAAFDNFDAAKIAVYDERKLAELLQNAGIIRNRLKIASTVQNAKAYLKIVEEFGNFDGYIWQFVKWKKKWNFREELKEIPSQTPESDVMSKDLRKRGFNFVGSTICYAFMQATGMVNDHLVSCFRHHEVKWEKDFSEDVKEADYYIDNCRYFRHFLTKDEIAAHTYFLNSRKFQTDATPDNNPLIKQGENSFRRNTLKRLKQSYPTETAINQCPKCRAQARTAKAKQCPKCFYNWREKN